MYSLSWGDFGSSLASTFQILRGQGELVDVTLSAGGRIFPAHKLVLSAASPLLMELLKVYDYELFRGKMYLSLIILKLLINCFTLSFIFYFFFFFLHRTMWT